MPRVSSTGGGATDPVRPTQALDAATLGERLRAARLGHGLILRQSADRSGLSRTFLSQVERDQVSPSVASLTKIAEALAIHLTELFLPPAQRPEGLVRADERVRMTLHPGEHWDEVLSPSLRGKLLVLQSTILPGAGSGAAYDHPADEECVIVLQGRLEIHVNEQAYEMTTGDALTLGPAGPVRRDEEQRPGSRALGLDPERADRGQADQHRHRQGPAVTARGRTSKIRPLDRPFTKSTGRSARRPASSRVRGAP